MTLYDRIADLSLDIEGYEFARNHQDTGFPRVTTTVSLHGDGETGRGEDVIYTEEDHRALRETTVEFPFAGEYTFDEFSALLDETDLFPDRTPPRDSDYRFRRWAFESAALDLALKQSDLTLAEALDEEYDPLRFVVSTGLGDPPSTDRVRGLLDDDPDLEFKLDPNPEWTPELMDELAATDAVRILDFKGQYEKVPVAQPPLPEVYEQVAEAFPDALLEDPALTDETRPTFDGIEGRVTWDHPITGVESVEALPFEPEYLNVKPSRFGTVESLLDTVEYCRERDIRMYGGGQFELDVGRQHIQALASLFYPDAPNDTAPRAYNDPGLATDLPGSPLSPPSDPRGFEWTPDTKPASEPPTPNE
ncbi:hypothetical protein [Halorussus caseinilyticus]|uniref:hypothetical protein n=1 Tax=Halorussus caseinilyticus TaxID=3034025 RepID=UPI0023E851B9|nr:hypothetical protein [Halorussus sp. DT72]